MRLPRGDEAVIDPRKIADYLLSPSHPVGRNKARVFESALGLTSESAPRLLEALKAAAAGGEAVQTSEDRFGRRYRIDFKMAHAGVTAEVRSAWLVPAAPEPPVFLTAFVL